MKPLNTLAESFGGSGADNLAVVADNDVAAGIGITVAFTKTVAEDGAVFIAAVDNACERNNVAVNIELSFECIRVVTESDENLFKLIDSSGNFETEELEPCKVDERHVAYGLDSSLIAAELLNPGQSPDMAVFIRAHGAVFGSLLKDFAQIGHILVNILFHMNNSALLGILQQVSVTELCIEHKLRQRLDIGHLKADFVAPLIALDGSPVDVDIGRLFETFEDGAVVGFRLTAGREIGQAANLNLLCQREGVGIGDGFLFSL